MPQLRGRSLYTALLLSGLAVVMLPLPALADAKPPASEEPSVFGEVIDVRVVQVEVVVTDRSGDRVYDLKPEDFRLEVDGREVPIDFFSEVRDGQTAAPPAEGATRPAGPAETGSEVGAEVGTSYLVFVDDYFSTELRRNEVLRSLQGEVTRLGPQDRMAIVAWDGARLTLLTDWTASRERLGSALGAALGRPAGGIRRAEELRGFRADEAFRDDAVLDGDSLPLDLPSAGVLRFGLSSEGRNFARNLSRQIEGTVSAVAGTLRTFATPPGRKVLLLLSGGWPFSIQQIMHGDEMFSPSRQIREGEELFRPLASTANLLGYTVYPVDVPGLTTRSEGTSTHEQEIEGTLDFLARETGGRAIRDGDRTLALAEVRADTRAYYWLGFTPTWQHNDKVHKVKVNVVRPGLKVRSRTNFLDLSKEAEVTMMLESALRFGSLPDSVPMPFRVGTPVRGKKRGTLEIPITLGLPVDALTIVPVGKQYAARAELRIGASSEGGDNSEIPVIPLELKSDKAPKSGGFVRFETKIVLRGKANRLVVALYDPLSGTVATAESKIAAP